MVMLNYMLNLFYSEVSTLLLTTFIIILVFVVYSYYFVLLSTYANYSILNHVNYNVDLFSMFIVLFIIITSITCYFIFKRYFITKNNIVPYVFILITLSSSLLVYSSNILVFFFYYESILLLSVALVWVSSPNRRSKQTAMYFLF